MGCQDRVEGVKEGWCVGVESVQPVAVFHLDGVDGSYFSGDGVNCVEHWHNLFFIGDGDIKSVKSERCDSLVQHVKRGHINQIVEVVMQSEGAEFRFEIFFRERMA